MLDFGWVGLPFIITLAALFGLYMAWTIGANDVANAMGTSVGSGALSLKAAIILASILEFSGAVLAGGSVTDTVRKGIVDPEVAFATIQNGVASFSPELYIFGMLAALLGTALWLTAATYFGMPVSTTHSIVGGVMGAGIVSGGILYGWGESARAVDWGTVFEIFQSWIYAPLLGGLFAFGLFALIDRLVLRKDDAVAALDRWRWLFIFLDLWIVIVAVMVKGLAKWPPYASLEWTTKNGMVPQAWIFATGVALGLTLMAESVIQRRLRLRGDPRHHGHDPDALKDVEHRFIALQIITAGSVAFAHGANDVANAIGPLAGIVSVAENEAFVAQASIAWWVLPLGGIGIVIGLATWGWRVMLTIGKKISEITPSRGFAAELAAAGTIILATVRGIPVSTSQILVGAVLGVGLARGVAGIDIKVLRDIVASWFLTLPVAALLAGLLFVAFRAMFGA